ncbi:hypothetical protein PQX77_002480 [Marasmius sp. AFHP31]|nr:hypothetical protein PQX77_002480 [Marasmius sp. AFHP31]
MDSDDHCLVKLKKMAQTAEISGWQGSFTAPSLEPINREDRYLFKKVAVCHRSALLTQVFAVSESDAMTMLTYDKLMDGYEVLERYWEKNRIVYRYSMHDDDPIATSSATQDDMRYSRTQDIADYPNPFHPQYSGGPTKESQTNQDHYGDNFDQCNVGRTSRDTYNMEGSSNVEGSYNVESSYNVEGSYNVENSYNMEKRLSVLSVFLPAMPIYTAPTETLRVPSFFTTSLSYFAATLPSVCFVVIVTLIPRYQPLLSRSSYLASDSQLTLPHFPAP